MDESRGLAGARVLVVDDEPSLRLLCRVNLELEGYEVLEAGSVQEARAALAAGGVAVVLLDLHVGGQRADELVSECRDQRPPAAVVVVSGSAGGADDLPAGADARLGKPFELDELLATVRDLARVHAGRRAGA